MLDFLWLGFSLLPTFIAAYFGYMFYQDKDKRKLMFALSFAFASISLAEKILPSTGFPFIQELYDSGGFPIIFAVLITGFSGLGNYKSFDKFFQAFLGASIITVVVSIFLLFDYPSIRLSAMIGLTFLTLGILIIGWLRKRKTGDLLFLFAIASFATAGFSQRLGFGTEFFLLCQSLAYVFIILVFILPTHDTQLSNFSFLKVQQQLAKTKNQLKELELKYKIIFEAVGDAIFVADIETRLIVDCNLEATKLVHRDRADIIGKHQNILHPKQERDGDFFAFQEHAHGDSEFIETQVITSNEELRDVAIKAGVFELNGKKMMVGIFRDVTELKKAEEANKFQADLLNHVGQAIIMVDNNRIIRFWNKAAEKLYGYSEEQALGHNVTELLGVDSPEEADEVSKRLMAGESWSTETLVKNRDGSIVPVILNRTPLFKEDGEFSGAASITTDITLQKNTEADLTFSLESLSSSLAKIQELNEKLRVIGGLTRHDVRNKLSAVTGYAYLLKKKHADEADVVEGLGKMEQAVKDSMKIFEFAKMYEQLGVEELTNIDVETKITEAAALFSGTLPKIINKCQGLTVLADSFLRQMFYNFVDNTIKYGQKNHPL